ncbi:hypothetical protein QFC19_009475 [Naganishia cerealis]|uniref:Uncharacterized protein n=1 Tax=Naganishia cerealis TaxID=610337 RepID=A0ACC2UV48_9TREE|nr:hypothetical protein QFC19_009475 [Naganishia cerealis]
MSGRPSSKAHTTNRWPPRAAGASSSRSSRIRRTLMANSLVWRDVDRCAELGDGADVGSTGCVNALSWSADGQTLLAAGDDTRYEICMWTPDTDTAPVPENPYPFKLADTISTGHTANIFSSKFLPGASHMTIASCAGDSQILVYDVERLDRLVAGGLRSQLGELNGMNGPGVRRLLLSVSKINPYLFTVAGTTPYAYLQDRRMVRLMKDEWATGGFAKGGEADQGGKVHCVRRFGLNPNAEEVEENTSGSNVSAGGQELSQEERPEEDAGAESEGPLQASVMPEPTSETSTSPQLSADVRSQSRHVYGTGISAQDLLVSPRLARSNNEDLDMPDGEWNVEEEQTDDAAEPQEGDHDGHDHDGTESDDDDDDDDDDDEMMSADEEELEAILADEEQGLYPAEDESSSPFSTAPVVYPRRIFKGARNVETVKDVTFLGATSDKVGSGSDDGNFFVWDKITGRLEGIWEGDSSVVNVIEQHPSLPLCAVSGIDSTVKVRAVLSSFNHVYSG